MLSEMELWWCLGRSRRRAESFVNTGSSHTRGVARVASSQSSRRGRRPGGISLLAHELRLEWRNIESDGACKVVKAQVQTFGDQGSACHGRLDENGDVVVYTVLDGDAITSPSGAGMKK